MILDYKADYYCYCYCGLLVLFKLVKFYEIYFNSDKFYDYYFNELLLLFEGATAEEEVNSSLLKLSDFYFSKEVSIKFFVITGFWN